MAFAALVILYLVAAPAFGIWGFVLARRGQKELIALRGELAGLRAAEAPETPPPAAPEWEAPPATPYKDAAPPPPEAAAPAAASPLPESSAKGAESAWRGLEDSLTSRWLVWVGALALCFAGAFLVKYTIDQGVLGPELRVLLGLLLGGALTGAGEWLRRRAAATKLGGRIDYVPPALTAAGVFTAFASGYSAYALYGLISPLGAFLLLAGIGVGAVALALLQGPFIALLGLLGGFLTPLLVQSETPAAWPLFAFLLVLTGSASALVQLRGWRWLGWAALAGAAAWPFLWYVSAWSAGDALPLGLYLLGLAAVFLLPRWLVRTAETPEVQVRQDRLAQGAAAVAASLAFALLRMDAYGTTSLIVLGLLCASFLTLARRDQALDLLAALGALLSLAAVAAWHLPAVITRKDVFYEFAGRDPATVPGPLLPPELLPFAGTAALLGLLFGLGGFLALHNARRPGLWAAISAATPIGLFSIAYWRIAGFELDLAWGAAALGLAGLALLAATLVRRDTARLGGSLALGAYATATVAAVSLALAMTLEQAWLTVALALQLPALAWIHAHLKERTLQLVAALVAGTVLVRLALNPFVVDYALTGGFLNWLLYGYGLPAAAFFVAARAFGGNADRRLTILLDAGALLFTALLITLQIRHAVVGPLDSPEHPLLEQSLQSLAWLVLALGLQLIAARGGQAVATWGARVLTLLAGVQVLLLQVLAANPINDPAVAINGPVGFNILVLAYAAPAVLFALLGRGYRRDGGRGIAAACGLAALVLGATYVTLEVRHAFHPLNLADGVVGDAELYAYSAAWLAYAGALLAIALKSGSAVLRHVSLAVLLGVTAKVFLIDMGSLTGLYRVASFLGLGLCLVGIGFLYQRLVFPAARKAGAG